MALNVAGGGGLEIATSSLVEEVQEGHALTGAERGGALAAALAGGKLEPIPVRKKGDTKDVDGAEAFEETHGEGSFAMWMIGITSIRAFEEPSPVPIPN
jgi:hypothetical protein